MGRSILAGVMISLLEMTLSCHHPSTIQQSTWLDDTTRWGTNGYVEYSQGSMPLILTIPHGGTVEPAEMADRISGTLGRYDTNTLELGRRIAAALRSRTGQSPYLIITHVHRKKLDTNRELLEAAQGSPRMQVCIPMTLKRKRKGRCGDEIPAAACFGTARHRHTRPWVELGYLLSPAQLALQDDSLNTPGVVAAASIGGLVKNPGRSLAVLLHGPLGLGALLEKEGYESVPSPSNPHPRGGHYFSGGYNTERHGSLDGGPIVALQMETPWHGVRDTEANQERLLGCAQPSADFSNSIITPGGIRLMIQGFWIPVWHLMTSFACRFYSARTPFGPASPGL